MLRRVEQDNTEDCRGLRNPPPDSRLPARRIPGGVVTSSAAIESGNTSQGTTALQALVSPDSKPSVKIELGPSEPSGLRFCARMSPEPVPPSDQA